jgi:pyridoxal phosphate enzyme (YggS family)
VQHRCMASALLSNIAGAPEPTQGRDAAAAHPSTAAVAPLEPHGADEGYAACTSRPVDAREAASVATELAMALAAVRKRVAEAAQRAGRVGAPPRLVAVSKTKPAAMLRAVYDEGQRHFGENYVQELCDKARDPTLPSDIAWHFIGQLQSNKAKALVGGVPGLWAVESVDSVKLADLLNKAAAAAGRRERLRVFVQVNTSGEPQKGGVEPGGPAAALARHIVESCPALQLAGLMTIGKLGEVASAFFERLAHEREAVAAALGVPPVSLELSMGMSGDYELAIAHGSTNVRVGSSIFGAREYTGSSAAASTATVSDGVGNAGRATRDAAVAAEAGEAGRQ